MENIIEVKALLAYPKSIVITTHRNPDGDAIGSTLAMYFYLTQMRHTVHMIIPSEYPEFLEWMPGVQEIIIYDLHQERSKEIMEKADIVICLDFNGLDRIDKLGEIVNNLTCQKIMIDHHLDPEPFVDYVFSDITASSTCEMIYDFILAMGHKHYIDVIIGESIMTGILTDTGSFRYSTSPKLYRIVAELLELGVDDYKLQDLIFNSYNEKQLRLLGHCLANRMEILEEYQTGIITLTKEDYAKFNISRGDTEGIVNYLLKMRNIKMAAFITEQPTIVKLSLRSKGDFSVQAIAQHHFKGGGHKNASGGSSYQNLEATVKKFKALLPQYNQALSAQH